MKTFFVDIDGVIYRNGRINKKVITSIKKRNNKLIFCTGRGYVRSLDVIKEYLDDDSILIIENGSKIVDSSGNKIYFQNISPKEKEIIKQIDCNKIEYILFNPNDSKSYISFSEIELDHVQTNHTSYTSFCKEMYNREITQITIKFKKNEFQKEFMLLCQMQNINLKLSENYVIINANDISKKSAILHCLEIFNIENEDIVIVGNDYNDLEMFDIQCKNKIAVVDEYTPDLLIKKATETTNFDNLANIIEKI